MHSHLEINTRWDTIGVWVGYGGVSTMDLVGWSGISICLDGVSMVCGSDGWDKYDVLTGC